MSSELWQPSSQVQYSVLFELSYTESHALS